MDPYTASYFIRESNTFPIYRIDDHNIYPPKILVINCKPNLARIYIKRIFYGNSYQDYVNLNIFKNINTYEIDLCHYCLKSSFIKCTCGTSYPNTLFVSKKIIKEFARKNPALFVNYTAHELK